MSLHSIAAYLSSRRHLVSCGLALLGLALILIDPVGLPGLILVVGFYLLGLAATREKPEVARYGFDPGRLERGLQRLIAEVAGRMPPPSTIRLQRIEFIIRTQILPGLEFLPLGSLDLYLVQRSAADYVPTAVAHYLGLPELYRRPESEAHQLLNDELRLVEDDLRRIADLIRRAQTDRLLAHHRFLRDRFSRIDVSQ
jgi:hypothetical protein